MNSVTSAPLWIANNYTIEEDGTGFPWRIFVEILGIIVGFYYERQ